MFNCGNNASESVNELRCKACGKALNIFRT